MSTLQSLRFQVSLATLASVFATAAVALLLPEDWRTLGGIIGCVVIGILGSCFAWWRLNSIHRLAHYANELKEGRGVSELKIGDKKLHSILRVIKELTEINNSANEGHRATLLTWQKVLQQFQDPNCPAAVAVALETPFPEEENKLLRLVDDFGKQLFAIRQRMALAMRVLNQVPVGIAAIDSRGVCRYMNAALERLLGLKQQSQWQRQHFARYIPEQIPTEQSWHNPEEQPLPAARVSTWLEENKGGSCPTYLVTEAKELIPVELILATPGQGEGLSVLVVYDLRPVKQMLTERLATDRMINFGYFIRNYISEVEPAVAKVISQGRLIMAEVKQTPQRSSLVPKMQALLSEANQLESIQLLNRFLYFLNESALPEAVKTEFELGDVARLVKDSLSPLLRARNLDLEIADQAGWLYGDEDRISAIFVGMMYHAIRATQDQELSLKLTRSLEAAPDGSTYLEATLSPAGPLLNPEHLSLIREPFGGLTPRNLWSFDELNGSPIGLLVAERLAAAVGGELDLRASSAGRLMVVLRLPSRLSNGREYANEAEDEVTKLALAETCGGWRLGRANEQVEK